MTHFPKNNQFMSWLGLKKKKSRKKASSSPRVFHNAFSFRLGELMNFQPFNVLLVQEQFLHFDVHAFLSCWIIISLLATKSHCQDAELISTFKWF